MRRLLRAHYSLRTPAERSLNTRAGLVSKMPNAERVLIMMDSTTSAMTGAAADHSVIKLAPRLPVASVASMTTDVEASGLSRLRSCARRRSTRRRGTRGKSRGHTSARRCRRPGDQTRRRRSLHPPRWTETGRRISQRQTAHALASSRYKLRVAVYQAVSERRMIPTRPVRSKPGVPGFRFLVVPSLDDKLGVGKKVVVAGVVVVKVRADKNIDVRRLKTDRS